MCDRYLEVKWMVILRKLITETCGSCDWKFYVIHVEYFKIKN